MKYKENFVEKISENDKKDAIEKAEKNIEKEKKAFEKELDSVKEKIEKIYQKIKTFVLKMEFPKHYQYNGNDYLYGPYENYVEEILKSSK